MTTPHPLCAAASGDAALVAKRRAVSVPDTAGEEAAARGVRLRVPGLRQEPGERPATGLRLDDDVLQLFHQVEALRSDPAPYVLQFIGVAAGTGVSTLAQGFAFAAAQEYRAPVLLLEGNSHRGQQSVTSAFRESRSSAAVHPVEGIPHLFRAALVDEELADSGVTVSELADVLELLKGTFGAVVLDCPPLEFAGPLLALCRHCDGTVLVVQAERDRRRDVNAAVDALSRLGGVVLGTVLNRQKNHLPRWLDKWLG